MDLLTVEQIKRLLGELDAELHVLSDDQRIADRQQIVRLLSDVVGAWIARGYSYAQIAQKLREKQVIRISEKTLREAVEGRRRKRRAKTQKSRGSGERSGGEGAVVSVVASTVPSEVVPAVVSTEKSEVDGTVKRKVDRRSSGGSSVGSRAVPASSGQFVPREDSEEL